MGQGTDWPAKLNYWTQKRLNKKFHISINKKHSTFSMTTPKNNFLCQLQKSKRNTAWKKGFSHHTFTNSQSSFDLFKRSNGQGTNVSTAAAALLSKTRAPFHSLSTAASEKNNYNTGAPHRGKHNPTVRCQNAKGLIDSPALNCVFELISSRYKGAPAVIVYQRCPLDSPNSSFSAEALWEREPPTVMHFQEAFENHYPIADRANLMPLIFPIALAQAACFDDWDKHIFTFCMCSGASLQPPRLGWSALETYQSKVSMGCSPLSKPELQFQSQHGSEL